MQASVSPPMMQANDAGPEPELFQKKAIKAFRKQGANPLRITRHHIQVNGQVLESLRTIVRMIAELEKLCGVDLLGFLNIFSEQKEATFVHYAKIILEMSHEMLLRGNQAVDKEMTSPRAPPDDAYSPTPVVLGKRKRSVSDQSNTDHVIHIVDKRPKLLPVETFCGHKEYKLWKRLQTHLVNEHPGNLPSTDKPLWCGDQKYTDPKQAAEDLAKSHIAKKGLAPAPGTNPSAAPTLQHGSPQLDRMPHDTRSASMSGSGLAPNTGTNIYSDPTAQSQLQMSPLPAVLNVPSDHSSHCSQPLQQPFPGAYSNASSARPPSDPNYRPNPETMHNGFSANYEHQQQMMPQNHQTSSAYQQLMSNYPPYQPMQNTLATPNMNQTANSPSQHAS